MNILNVFTNFTIFFGISIVIIMATVICLDFLSFIKNYIEYKKETKKNEN